jgi:UDP-2,3-diacylglucosamine pyrophosphatase LpxH
VNRYALCKIYRLLRSEEADIIIHLGDIYDFFNFGKYSRSLNVLTPEAELRKSKKLAHEFWDKIHAICPKSKKIQLIGNHDMRLAKRIKEKIPEYSDIFDIRNDFFNFPNVEVLESDRDFVEIDNIYYCHGWLLKRWSHVNYFNKSVVHGHTHRASLIVKHDISTDYRYLFELDCGHLVNETALPFNYTASKYSKWKKGLGIIDKGNPRLVLL